MSNLAAVLDERFPGAELGSALSWQGGSVGWKALIEEVRAQAAWWQDRTAPAEPVGVLLPVGHDLALCLLALFYAGRPAVLADPAGGLGHIAASFALAGVSKVAMTGPTAAAVNLFRLFGGVRALRPAFLRPGLGACVETLPASPALLTYTSGSTGKPKAIVRSHEFLRVQQEILTRELDLGPGRVCMPALPAFVLSSIGAGCHTVLPTIPRGRLEKVDYPGALSLVDRQGVNRLIASPAFVRGLAQAALQRPRRTSWEGLRIFTGGGAVDAPLCELVYQAIPGASLTALYGSSEAEPMAAIDGRGVLRAVDETRAGRGIPAGHPVPEVSLRIIRGASGAFEGNLEAAVCRPGETGEIIVSGEHVNRAYLHDPEAERLNKIRDGERVWHRTGDAGYLEDTGALWLCGRSGQSVRDSAGRTVYPFCVEQALVLEGIVGECCLLAEADGVVVFSPPSAAGRLGPWLDAHGLGNLQCFGMRHIPRDARHRTKPDAAAIRRALQKAGYPGRA